MNKSPLDEYFTNPENVNPERKIFINYDYDKSITPEEFYGLNEVDQKTSHILMKRMECNDGFSMSIQAGDGLYSSPRVTCRSTVTNIYDSYEIGFPSEVEDLIMEYKDSLESDPLNTVYGYVPKEIVEQVIAKHGGIKI